ncbi:restriction endonuclease subunit S [Ramlibacter sp. WS9]|uniref:restriction endonuclease subunit S n=1 Tax=Ramlibacter sp. WS9 TaxID=1882741 RepID=UPI001E5D2ECD|nr:restriction endonuclease subunit S [Ramlibacter sp. WS9]
MNVRLGQKGGTQYLPLSAVAPLVRREIAIDSNATYTELGVRSFNKGTFHRRTVTGAEFTWQGLYRINKDDLVFSNIMAWEGAVAMAKPEDDGCIGNHRMLTCACDRTRVAPAYLAHYFTTSEGMAKLVAASTGTVARNRTLTATALGKIEVPVPALEIQERIVEHMQVLAGKALNINDHLGAVEADAERLLAVRFRDAISDAPLRTMATVAPLVRREEEIDLEGSYLELGVRSFGKGTFHKPPLAGAEVGTKRLFRIEAGDLLFSNVFAWEGAIAIARQVDAGRFGSHRFMSCVADESITSAEFLRYFFLTNVGLAKISEASPGGAGRNRTLGLEKLMAIEVPLPSLDVQRTFNALQARIAELKAKHAAIREANQALVPSTLERVFAASA